MKPSETSKDIASSPTSAEVRCSDTLSVFAERADLIAISGFFESMLALKPSKTEAVIDPRGFCDDETTLALLVQFATQRSAVPFQQHVSSIAELIFLVDPLQLTDIVQRYIHKKLVIILNSPVFLTAFLVAIDKIITRNDPSQYEIEEVLKMLIVIERASTQASANDCTSLIIVAMWLKKNKSTAEVFAEFGNLQSDLNFGVKIPAMLQRCDEAVPGLLYWITLVHACEIVYKRRNY